MVPAIVDEIEVIEVVMFEASALPPERTVEKLVKLLSQRSSAKLVK